MNGPKHLFFISGFGLLSCCGLTFLIMFVPKSRQLSAIGKEGIYLEDQVNTIKVTFHRIPFSKNSMNKQLVEYFNN